MTPLTASLVAAVSLTLLALGVGVLSLMGLALIDEWWRRP